MFMFLKNVYFIKSKREISESKSEKLRFLPHFKSNKGFKGTVVNRTSLNGGPLEITFTIPLGKEEINI